MKSSKTLEKVRRVYDYAETTLWAALLAFVIHFVVFVIEQHLLIFRFLQQRSEKTNFFFISFNSRFDN